jgi:hypothetical protein
VRPDDAHRFVGVKKCRVRAVAAICWSGGVPQVDDIACRDVLGKHAARSLVTALVEVPLSAPKVPARRMVGLVVVAAAEVVAVVKVVVVALGVGVVVVSGSVRGGLGGSGSGSGGLQCVVQRSHSTRYGFLHNSAHVLQPSQ